MFDFEFRPLPKPISEGEGLKKGTLKINFFYFPSPLSERTPLEEKVAAGRMRLLIP